MQRRNKGSRPVLANFLILVKASVLILEFFFWDFKTINSNSKEFALKLWPINFKSKFIFWEWQFQVKWVFIFFKTFGSNLEASPNVKS
jgi:hypothetical protein